MTSAMPLDDNSPIVSMPKAGDVAHTLKLLLDRPCPVSLRRGVRAGSLHTVTATFIDSTTEELAAICSCDMAFAAYSGASIVLVPVNRAKESIKAGKLTESLEENAFEVFNILSTFFNNNPRVHVKLEQMYASLDELPAEVRKAARKARFQLDFTVDIKSYGPGALSFYGI
ncbi:MAG: hypothetical protein AAGI01_03960 [Myxococcota bacterium]